jgi:hypothetical protein
MHVVRKILGTSNPIQLVMPDGWDYDVKTIRSQSGLLTFYNDAIELDFRIVTKWKSESDRTKVLYVGYKTISRDGRDVSIMCGTKRITETDWIEVTKSLHFVETPDFLKLLVDKDLCK